MNVEYVLFFYLQLNDFREERLELMKLEAEQQAMLEEEESKRRIAKENKEKKKRVQDKLMVCNFLYNMQTVFRRISLSYELEIFYKTSSKYLICINSHIIFSD